MPRYFLHMRDLKETIDTEGIELAGEDDARIEVIRSAGEALADYGAKFWHGPALQVWMTDENNVVICELHIAAQC